jgi:3-hydroxyacyl-CoA dehydrogenase/3a,7a,12a-trihydroxy-5b-cholest-24-enoyl-CoA hydratase
MTIFVRGAGGWGGDRGPASDVNAAPEREPDAVITEKTNENQALLYRLSGDWNPLHADPEFAGAFGFPKPILHGLCTFGHVVRHVLKSFRNSDARYFKSIKVRFAESVFPGETLQTEMWKESESRIVFRCKVLERNKVVISNAAIELHTELPKASPAPKAEAQAPAAAAAAAGQGSGSAEVFAAIGRYVQKHPELVGKVNNVYLFKLTQPESAWTLDLKNGQGSVAQGAVGKADCTLELTDADFMAMTSGKADPQKLYFGGKLKVSGNVMASQKLNFLTKIDPREAAAPSSEPKTEAPKADAPKSSGPASAPAIFKALKERLAKSPELATEVGALLQFKVTAPESAWVVDLRSAPGSVSEGTQAGATATLTLADEDLLALAKGTVAARELFQRSKLRVDGEVRAAHRLGFLKNLV